MITFGEWLPDQPDYMNAGVTEAINVVPAYNGYRSLNEFVSYSSSASDTILGIFSAKDATGNVKLFAGDSERLYLFNQTGSALDDVSAVGGYSLTSGERWRFIKFGVLSTDAPKADFIAAVRDFVWTANIDEGSGRVPYRCYWSGFNDITSWTAGTSRTTSSWRC